MTETELRELLAKLDRSEPSKEASSLTKLLHLAVALNEWNYPCVSRIEPDSPQFAFYGWSVLPIPAAGGFDHGDRSGHVDPDPE